MSWKEFTMCLSTEMGSRLHIPQAPPQIKGLKWAFMCCGTVQIAPTLLVAHAAGDLAATTPPLVPKAMLLAE
jgi:hypothetical protein